MSATSLPLTIITGFLGSGKTTLLNGLLKDSRLERTAVIVNEFGEIGLDHLLVESAMDQMMLLDNGCLCCTVRGDLVDTLLDLLRRVEAEEIPAFDRVMVETTGLADPAPIVQTLATSEAVAERFHLHAVVTTVDGINGADTITEYPEARAQAAMADLLLVTKTDRPEANPARVSAALASLNPTAPRVAVSGGIVDPAVIIELGRAADHLAMEDAGNPDAEDHVHDGACGHDHDHDHGHHHGHDHAHGSVHGFDIQSVSLVLDEDMDWETLAGWLDWILALRGADILRVKGIVQPKGFDRPVLIHGVQHVFFPPTEMGDWPDEDRRSRLVVIARDIPATALKASLASYRANRAALDAPISVPA
ncbi:CobW family GTP-binding protein [Pelagibacterium montanilacus]|uniref:CobW family GTP-binding protein n=1 Tax=Pelagibacterium montanilacus TaxID=2185280 RepID=UPI000F8E3F7C|nr:GTP-binding protein [Pelagibacterium montanilacus]